MRRVQKLLTPHASEKTSLDSIKSEFFTRKNEPKPNFVSIISNLTGKGKEVKLAKLKTIIPDIEDKIKFLKAVENIKSAGSIQVGTYSRSLLGAGGIVTGNPILLLSSILAVPKVAVTLLRAYGKFEKIASEIIEKIINKIKTGTKLDKKEAKIFNDMVNEKEATIKPLVTKAEKETKTELRTFLKEEFTGETKKAPKQTEFGEFLSKESKK